MSERHCRSTFLRNDHELILRHMETIVAAKYDDEKEGWWVLIDEGRSGGS